MSHKAIVATVNKVEPIQGADKIHLGYVLGEKVVISKDWNVGYIGIFFKADLQLSEEFVFENSLSRNSEKNKDSTKTGFFESNRRVRVQPFLKVRSEGFFTSLEAINYTGVHISELPVGYEFDELNGKKICCKYVSEESKEKSLNANKQKQAKKDFAPLFKKHVDSEQFKHYAHTIPEGALLSFHAKVHGTSARYSYTETLVELPEWKRKVNYYSEKFLGQEVFKEEKKWEIIVGTRNVVLKPQQKDKEGFHGSEAFRYEVAEMLAPFMVKGMTIYGEIAGFANSKSIMPSHETKSTKDKKFTKKYGEKVTYTYNCKEHEYRFHVYRITYQTVDGESIDFTDQQIKAWCEARGILSTIDIYPQFVYDGDIEKLSELVEQLTERPDCLTEDYIDPSHPSEGIIVRVDYDGLTPKFFKNKSYYFKVMESICEAVDIETVESISEGE